MDVASELGREGERGRGSVKKRDLHEPIAQFVIEMEGWKDERTTSEAAARGRFYSLLHFCPPRAAWANHEDKEWRIEEGRRRSLHNSLL